MSRSNGVAPLNRANLPSETIGNIIGVPFPLPVTQLRMHSEGIMHMVRRCEGDAWNHYIYWPVDAKRLKSMNKQAVSSAFMLPLSEKEPAVAFVLMIHPKVSYLSKGGNSFKKAKGICRIELKCKADVLLAENSTLVFRLMVGSSDPTKQQSPRGPIKHDFFETATAELPQRFERWDMSASIDEGTQRFIVALEVQSLKSDGGKERF